ncbi:D-ribose transporter ATP binding protein [Petrotoga sp. 9T1HF07.CasAA.8.2]|uniref:sugar ABC transporter ATP-binding protein n=1 Tax=Petrotoga sp. 9T1HF07.CasAA.8.2 TaxID=1434329 RepID=UPI000CC0DD07|nr:sugar ABC transporter ATP-binding protein [Petrotoga sp. 9T1HF07.CasAA.8.2]PNR87639.1 D-ribose transporter ATP binding protein [Petrotoga sp. 9T1HF07.CasAA.8.2]
MLLVEVKDLKKSYGGVKALKGVDFDLKNGECHALVGENGAGKSTLIKCLAGVIKADSGKMILENEEVYFNSPKDALEKGIAAVYQEPMIYPQLSVVENLFLGKEIKTSGGSINWKAERKKAEDLLKKVGLKENILDFPMGNLSMAFQQLVLIARSLLFTAKILIFDEPTAILTEQETLRLFDIIKELKNQGLGIIYISHRLEELEKIADRITIMRDGEVKGTFLTNELSRDKIIELMAGKHIIEKRKRESIKGETILEVKNFTKEKMFKNISFKAKKGEILGFSGLVGAGRSELMQSIFGIYPADSGTLIFENKQLNIRSPEQAIKAGIAYLPEDRSSEGLFLNFSIIDNIRISILERLKKNFGFIDEENSLKLANDYLKLLEIKAPSVLTQVKNLSGGNQQKVLISKWLATTPKLLILDEPTRGVDVAVKSEIHELIFNLAEEGLSIILISSELPEILKLSDRVIVMHEGIISGIFEKEDINETNLIKASIGENMVVER